MSEETDAETKAGYLRRIDELHGKQHELTMKEAKINRYKLLSFAGGPTKSHYDSSVPSHARRKSGFLDATRSPLECVPLYSYTSSEQNSSFLLFHCFILLCFFSHSFKCTLAHKVRMISECCVDTEHLLAFTSRMSGTGRSVIAPLEEEDETRRDRESDSSRELSPALTPSSNAKQAPNSSEVQMRKVPGRTRRQNDQGDSSRYFTAFGGGAGDRDAVDASGGGHSAKSKFELELDVSILVQRGRCVLHPKLPASTATAAIGAAGQQPKNEANKQHEYERRWREFNVQRTPVTDLTIFVLPGSQLKVHFGPHDKLGLPQAQDLKRPASAVQVQPQSSAPAPSWQTQRTHVPAVGDTSSSEPLIYRPEQQVASSKRPCLYAFFGLRIILVNFSKVLLIHIFEIDTRIYLVALYN